MIGIGPGPMYHMGLAYYWQVRVRISFKVKSICNDKLPRVPTRCFLIVTAQQQPQPQQQNNHNCSWVETK